MTETQTFPPEIIDVLRKIGKVEWGATAPATAEEHGAMTVNSVQITAETFAQTEPQPMNGLYAEGTETIVCHTGTSPNSANIARALTGAWNHLVDLVGPAPEA